MSDEKRPWKPWGDHPVVVLIFLIAALIPIAIFVRGNLGSTPDNSTSPIIIRVATESGDSVPGAKTILLYSDGGVSQYTDANGTVTYDLAVDLNAFRIIVEAEGFQIQELQVQSLTNDVINVRLEERKGEKADVILRVVDSQTEFPISNAEITLISNGDLFKEVSDSDGFAQFTLDFPVEGKIDTQISISAEQYKIENQTRTLLPGKLQYVLLSTNSISVQIPVVPISGQESTKVSQTPTTASNLIVDPNTLIGSGVNISYQTGSSGLRVVILRPNSQPWEGVYTEIYEQISDVTGNPARGDRIDNGSVNQQGLLDYNLSAGVFALCVSGNATIGYNWTNSDCIYNLDVSSGRLTLVQIQPGQLEVGIAGATGEPWQGIYYEVYTQKQDVNGNPVIDERVAYGHTDNAGFGREVLTPGVYALLIDLRGYNWGDTATGKGLLNIGIEKGKANQIIINMGLLVIGLRNSAGDPATNVYLEVYTQANDINGQRIIADRVWYGRTDIGGIVQVSLTEGSYALRIDEDILYDILIESGKITDTDGTSFTIK